MAACYKCGEPFLEENEIPQDAVCKRCSSWVHCCANCVHYDEYAHNKCREPKAAYVFDRLGKNQCALFKVKRVVRPDRGGSGGGADKKPMSPRAEQADREGRARDELERLFKK